MSALTFEKLYYNQFLLRFTVVFIPLCMLLQLYGLKRSYLFLLALNGLQILMWFVEKQPYQSQSTGLMIMMNFVFILHFLIQWAKSFNSKLVVLAAASSIVALFTYKRNIYKGINFFKVESVYVEKLRRCKGKSYQSLFMSSMIRRGSEDGVHPLFIRDYTYFGYFQLSVLYNNYDRIIQYNKGRGVRYFSSVEPCHVDTAVVRILREKFPAEKIITTSND